MYSQSIRLDKKKERKKQQHCKQLTQFFRQIAYFQSSSGWRVTRRSRDSSWVRSLGTLWSQVCRTLQGIPGSSSSIRWLVKQLVPGKEYIYNKIFIFNTRYILQNRNG